MHAIRFSLNGKDTELGAEWSGASLLDALREGLGRFEVKCGCEQGFCGACVVLVDGKPLKSCVRKAAEVEGKSVVTAAGLESAGFGGAIDRLEGAVQCGYCFPGIAASLGALMAGNPDPDREAIEKALEGHVCRCTGYEPIVAGLTGGWPSGAIPLRADGSVGEARGSDPRGDASPKLRGALAYSADLAMEGMLHVALRRSDIPSGSLLSLDVEAARRAPGVVAVLRAGELPGERRFGAMRKDQPVLVCARDDGAAGGIRDAVSPPGPDPFGPSCAIRSRSDALALVVALTRAEAGAAADLILPRYEETPAIYGAEDALSPGARAIWPEGNLAHSIITRSGKARGGDTVRVSGHYSIGPVEHAYLEPEAALAWIDAGGGLVVRAGSQNIHADAEELAAIAGLPREKVEVRLAWVGGAYGGKEDLTAQPYAAIAAIATGKPCLFRLSRAESILASTKKHPIEAEFEISADRDGTFDAIRARAVSATGPYLSLSSIVLTRFATQVAGPYSWRSRDVEVRGAYTNGPIAGAMRGFGVNQACFALETLIDELALELGMPAVALREKNLAREGRPMGLGETARDCAGLARCLAETVARLPAPARGGMATGGRKRGVGYALAHKNISLGNGSPRDFACVRLALDPGRELVELRSAATDSGQGLLSVLRRVVADTLGIPYESVVPGAQDTANAPPAGVTSASRQTYMSGNAAARAALALRGELARGLETALGAAPGEARIEGGTIFLRGARYDLWQAARAALHETLLVDARFDAPPTMPLSSLGEAGFRSHIGYSWACHGVEVEVDEETSSYRVLRIVASHDVGRVINARALLGQIQGGVAMGLGYAATERLELKDGAADGRMARLGLLKARDLPPVEIVLVEDPLPGSPGGARGIGEISTVPIAAALANAIADATGRRLRVLPLGDAPGGLRYAGR